MTAGRDRRDAFSAPLDADLLIEASAGTGKTYALTTLAARLIVEEHRAIDDLLIVTFTISAAGELRTRVRRTLQTARRAVAEPGAPADQQARDLWSCWRRLGIRETDALTRLRDAVRDFDRANITTIHGFCQRALLEFALHAGTPFSFGVSGDDALAVAAGTRDFWRRRMTGEPIALLEYAKSENFVPDEDTTAWVAGHHAKRQEIRGAGSPDSADADLRSKRDEWLEALSHARNAWSDPAQRQAFLEVADPDRWTKTNRNGVAVRGRTIIEAFDAGAPQELAPNLVRAFGTSALKKGFYKNNPAPSFPLFDHFERAGELGDEYGRLWLAGRRHSLLHDVGNTLHHNSWIDRRLGFDALLVELHRALTGERGAELARRIRTRYPVALIDEFQDTDRLQTEIFRKVFPGDGDGDGDGASGRLFVVGDPKQSIYRFRGADVFAYLEAQGRLSAASQPLSLENNYRSTPGLIRAVNEIFARPRPFVLPEFAFAASAPADRRVVSLVVNDEGDDPTPFQFVLMPRAEGGKRTKPETTRLAAEQCAREIVRLIALGKDGAAMLENRDGSKRLGAGDIAVLVRKGDQGRAVAEALRALGADSVELGTDNIFESAEADTLYRLLRALCLDESEYRATPLLRGALAADLFGLHMEELAGLQDDDDVWDQWRSRAREWSDVWRERGIATLMRRILFAGDPDCSANLLAYPNGPRRLTNYLHLADLLHEAETRNRPSRQGLLDWFQQSRAESRPGDETAQLRLESDEDLVKIVTVHRAKGLEFPVVFYPFAWDGRRPPAGRQRAPTAEYYDPDRETPVLDLCPSDEAYARERVEEHADELRLLYVALTRAQHRCVVTWALDGQAEYAPMAWLLHGDTDVSQEKAAQALDDNASYMRRLSAAEWQTEVRQFAERASGAISVREVEAEALTTQASDDAGKAEPLAARTFEGKLELIRQRTSYSALSTGAGAPERDRDEVELPDHDEATAVEAPETPTEQSAEEAETIFNLPGGGRTGNCLHEIFERYLGDPDTADLEQVCRAVLPRYGFHDKWLQAAAALVENALDTPLARPGEAGGVFRLSDLEQPITEMEFHLPVATLNRTELGRCLEEHGYDHRLPDDDAKINGFLHGFIDLTARHDGRWYVMDYKSNRLGPDLAAYSEERIAQSMRHHGYHLQYLLYLTALHRLLRLRLPEYDYDRDVGGAFYLFLRGMRPNVPGSGVFRRRPSRACIEAIDACFDRTP